MVQKYVKYIKLWSYFHSYSYKQDWVESNFDLILMTNLHFKSLL